MSTKAVSKNIITPEFRASFLCIFETETDPTTGAKTEKRSLIMMFPKKSASWKDDLPWLWDIVNEALLKKFTEYQGMPEGFKDINAKCYPVKDGDAPNTRGNVQEAHKGHWCVRAMSTLFNPAVNLINGVTGELGKMTEANCFSGCYFQAQIHGYYFDKGTNLGVGIGLNNLKFTREGESLGGSGENAASAFGIAPTESSASAAFDTPAGGDDNPFA